MPKTDTASADREETLCLTLAADDEDRDLEDPLEGHHRGHEVDPGVRQAGEGLVDAGDEGGQGDQGARGDVAVDHEQGAEAVDGGGADGRRGLQILIPIVLYDLFCHILSSIYCRITSYLVSRSMFSSGLHSFP